MTGARARWLTPLDVQLLARLDAEPNLVRAARGLGIGRDRAVYRLARLRRLYGGAVARGQRGGHEPGSTRLTRLGRRLLGRERGDRPGSNHWTGVYRAFPTPRVVIDRSSELEVAFRARDGGTVRVAVDPEAILVGRRRVALSARNVLPARVERSTISSNGTASITARWNSRTVRVALTAGSVRRLGLTPGRRTFLYVKAVAVRRLR